MVMLFAVYLAFVCGSAAGSVAWTYMSRLGIVSDLAFSSLSNSVYWTSKLGRLMAVDGSTGKELWAYNMKQGLVDKSKLSSPIIYEGKVFVGGITCVNMYTGKPIWKRDMPNSKTSTVGVSADGIYALAGSTDGLFYALAAKNGSFLFEKRLVGKKLTKVVIHQTKERTIALVGSQPMINRESSDLRTPLDKGGYLYAIDVRARDIMWKFSPSPGAFFFGAASEQMVVGGAASTGAAAAPPPPLVYIASSDPPKQKTFVHALSTETGKEAWRYEAQGRILSAPVLCPIDGSDGGSVYVTSLDGRVTSINAVTGKRRWVAALEASISGSVVLECNPRVPRYRRLLYVGNNQGKLSALDRNSGVTRWSFRPANSKHAIFSNPALIPNAAGNVSVIYGNLNGDLIRVDAPDYAGAGSGSGDGGSGSDGGSEGERKGDGAGSGGDAGSGDGGSGRDTPSHVLPEEGSTVPVPHDPPGRNNDNSQRSDGVGDSHGDGGGDGGRAPPRTPGSPTAAPSAAPSGSADVPTRAEGLELPYLWLVLVLFVLLIGVLVLLYDYHKPRIVAAYVSLKRRLSPQAVTKLEAMAGAVESHWHRFSQFSRSTVGAIIRYFENDGGLELGPLGSYTRVPQDNDNEPRRGGRDGEGGEGSDSGDSGEGDYDQDEEEVDDVASLAVSLERRPPLGPPPVPAPAGPPPPLPASSQGMRQRIGSDTPPTPPTTGKRLRSRSRGESSDSQLEEFYRPGTAP